MLDMRNSTVFFISDGVGSRDAPDFAHRISVFEPADNVAITAFEVRPVPINPLGYEAWLEVHNYGKATNVKLSITGSPKDNITRNLRIRANDTFKELFDLSSFQGGTSTLSV